MKKLVLKTTCKSLLFIISIVFIASCTKENFEEAIVINESKINFTISSKSTNEQKVSYSLLNEFEKEKLWKDKTRSIIKNSNYNKYQVKLLREFINNLNSKVFINGSDESEIFKNVFIKEYLVELKANFMNEEIISIFYIVSNNTIEDDKLIKGNTSKRQEPQDLCDCLNGSIFECSGYETDCNYLTQEEEEYCNEQSTHCGFLWLYQCDGICRSL